MTGVLDGVKVLDLTDGIAGPVTAMLLADHGAQVTKIEPPGGDPTRAFSGAQVWHRGKRSAVLDLEDPTDRERVLALAAHADVLIENFAPGVAARSGPRPRHAAGAQPAPRALLDHRVRRRRRATPTGPAVDALVAARTGHQWESRGVPGGTLARLADIPPAFPDLVVPDDCWVAAPRPGPLHSGVPWVSMAAAYSATLAISAALRVREQTGRGQRVSTSLFQGVLATTLSAWQRTEHADTPELPELDQRPARAQGRVPLRRRPVDPPVGAAPRLRHQRGRGRPRAAHREDHPPARRDHAHRHGRQRDAPAAPLPAAHGGGGRQVPVGAVGRARRRGRRAAAAAALAGRGAARPRVPRRRLRHRSRRSRARPGAPGRARVRPARVPHRRAHRAAGRRRTHRRGARRSRRARRRRDRGAAPRRPRPPRRWPVSACSTSASRSPVRGAR